MPVSLASEVRRCSGKFEAKITSHAMGDSHLYNPKYNPTAPRYFAWFGFLKIGIIRGDVKILVDEEHELCIIYDSRFPAIIMYTLACSLALAYTQLKDYISNSCLMNGWGWAITAAAAMCGRLVCHVWEH